MPAPAMHARRRIATGKDPAIRLGLSIIGLFETTFTDFT